MRTALAGRTLTGSDFRVPRLATADLRGRTVLDVFARGKHLLMRLSDDMTLHTHLRMDGAWHLYRPPERWRGGPGFQIRVVLSTEDVHAVGYRLAVVDLVRTRDEASVVGHLGPDVLGADWDPAVAIARLQAQWNIELGAALLDQRNLAGIGTIYMSELCFMASVSPWTPVSAVTDLPGIVDHAHRIMTRNAEAGRQVTTSDPRSGRRHWVYGRAGRPCLRCGTTIKTAEVGIAPRARVTYWCPTCQPAGRVGDE